MRRRSFLINAAGFAAAIAGGFWLKDNVLWRKPKVVFPEQTAWIALENAALPLPVVKAMIGGREVLALIDSGAQYSVMDRALADTLLAEGVLTRTFDMPMVAYGVGGQAQVGRGTTLDLDISGVKTDALRVAILELGPLAQSQGLGVGVILGRDIMAQMVVELDLGADRVRFISPDKWRDHAGWRTIPTKVSGDALTVEVSVEGAVIEAVLDTGASSMLSLSESTATEAGLLDGRDETRGDSLVLGGVSRARWIRVASLTTGDKLYRDVGVPVYPSSPLPNYPDALLGIGAFEGATLAIDMGSKRLFVAQDMDITVGPTRD